MPEYSEHRIVPYSLNQMFDLVADVESYPEFLPWIMDSTITERHPTEFKAILTIGYKLFKENYTSRVMLIPYEQIEVVYIDGPFKRLNNVWKFIPVDETTSTINFFIDFEFKNSLMQAVMTSMFHEAVRYVITAFEKRAKELYS